MIFYIKTIFLANLNLKNFCFFNFKIYVLLYRYFQLIRVQPNTYLFFCQLPICLYLVHMTPLGLSVRLVALSIWLFVCPFNSIKLVRWTYLVCPFDRFVDRSLYFARSLSPVDFVKIAHWTKLFRSFDIGPFDCRLARLIIDLPARPANARSLCPFN